MRFLIFDPRLYKYTAKMGFGPNTYRLTASEVVAEVQAGSLTVEDYASALLDRIEQRDSQVEAWAYLDREYVLKQARDLDKVPIDQRGPLHGVAIGVKDVIYTKGTIFVYIVVSKREDELTKLPCFRHAHTAQLTNLRGKHGSSRCWVYHDFAEGWGAHLW